MAGGRKPGPECGTPVDPDTLCRQRSVAPGTLRPTQAERAWWDTAVDAISETFDSAVSTVTGTSKSALLALLDKVLVETEMKPDSPESTALLRHYVSGKGAPYDLSPVPKAWQDWIVKQIGGKPVAKRRLNPYNSGLYDLRNGLGHFEVSARRNRDGTMTYTIQDRYQFGFKQNDTGQQGRHGFPLGELDPDTVAGVRMLLPDDDYRNPGGFEERWEIKEMNGEQILLIPQEVLDQHGTPFPVKGRFVR